MGVRMGIALPLGLCALALPAAPAAAAPAAVPPENSAATQYTEALPGAGGDRPTGDLRERRDRVPAARALGAEQAARLEALGEEGEDAARIAASSVPPVPAPGAAGRGSEDRAGTGGAGSGRVAGGSGLGEILRTIAAASHSGGIGPLLPLLIALIAAAALVYALARRRERGSPRRAGPVG